LGTGHAPLEKPTHALNVTDFSLAYRGTPICRTKNLTALQIRFRPGDSRHRLDRPSASLPSHDESGGYTWLDAYKAGNARREVD